MKPRVLITGAAGFLAGHLADALRTAGPAEIAGADIRAIPAGRVDAILAADLLASGETGRVVAEFRPTEVYHLMGMVRGSDDDVMQSNVASTRMVLDAVRADAPGATVVLVGSAAEYGAVPPDEQPVSESWQGSPAFAYGRAKQQVTAHGQAAAAAGMRVVVARPFNVVGAGVPPTLVVGALVQRLRDALAGPAPRQVIVGEMASVRDFVDARDVGAGLVVLARHGVSGEAYNLCTGRGHVIADVVERLVSLAGGGIRVEQVEGLGRVGEVSALVGSPAKASGLGWRATHSLDASLGAAWAASESSGGGS